MGTRSLLTSKSALTGSVKRVAGGTAAAVLLLMGIGTKTALMQVSNCAVASLYPTSALLGYQGGPGSFGFSLSGAYSGSCFVQANPSQSWVSTSVLQGPNGTVTYSVAANPSSASRAATILVGGNNVPFAITQSGAGGTASQPALLATSPSYITFPSTTTFTTATRTIVVSSPRYATSYVNVVPVTPPDLAYKVSPASALIVPGGSATLTVSFSPTAVGTVASSLTLQLFTGTVAAKSEVFIASSTQPVGAAAILLSGAGTGTPGVLTAVPSTGSPVQVSLGFVLKLNATGGRLPYRWTLATALPIGLNLDPATGEVYGLAPSATGTYKFSATVTDAAGNKSTSVFSFDAGNAGVFALTFGPPLTLLPGTTGVSYFPTSLNGSGLSGPFDFSVATGSVLPPGLSLDTILGTLTGTPQIAQTSHFQLQVAQHSNPTNIGVGEFDLTVVNPVITRIVEGGAWKTTITLVNLGAQDANFPLVLHAVDSTPLTLPFVSLGSLSTVPVHVPFKGSVRLETAGAPGNTSIGWAELQVGPSDLIGGTAVFRQAVPGRNDYEAAVPVSGQLFQRMLSPFDNLNNFTTAIAMTNAGNTTLGIDSQLRDEQGNVLDHRLPTLAPLNHTAYTTAQMFPATANIRGVAEFQTFCGQQPCFGLPLLGLRFNPAGAFTSFNPLSPDLASLTPPAGNVVTVARIADGGAFTTSITLVNLRAFNTADPHRFAQVTVRFWSETGSLVSIPVLGQPTVDSRYTVPVPIGGAVTLQTNGVNPVAGWAEIQVQSGERVGGTAVFRQRVAGRDDQEAAVPVSLQLSTNQIVPFDNVNGFATAVAVTNPSDTSIQANLEFRDENGIIIQSGIVQTISGRNEFSFSIPATFASTVNRRGVLQITSPGGGFSIIGLRFNPTGPFTSYNPLPGN